MNKASFLSVAVLALAFGTADAGSLVFRFRDSAGNMHNITSMEDARRLFTTRDARGNPYIPDYKTYRIFKQYIDDVSAVKRRVKDIGHDITVTVNASEADAYSPGSWSTGPDIQIQTWDSYRAISTLAHEVGHSYMKDKCGKFPTDNLPAGQTMYGPDGKHFLTEILNPRTAFLEAYAELHGDLEGSGQERIGCPGQGGLEQLVRETNRTYQDAEGKTQSYYDFTKWKDIASADDMWATESINAAMLRDFVRRLPKGAAKAEEFVCSDTLQDAIKAWVAKYPEDAAGIAKIVDANTNYLMRDADLKALTGANDYVDKERAGLKAKYQGKNPCDTVKELFTSGGGGGLPGGGGEGTGTGGTGKGMKRFR